VPPLLPSKILTVQPNYVHLMEDPLVEFDHSIYRGDWRLVVTTPDEPFLWAMLL
jgi:hypothetical protein